MKLLKRINQALQEGHKITIELCPHIPYCNVRKFIRDNHRPAYCHNNSMRRCETYKFYERYKDFDFGMMLGI